MSSFKYETLSVSVPKPFVCMVQLNRPEKRNAMNGRMWEYVIIYIFYLIYYLDVTFIYIFFSIEKLNNALMIYR